MTVKHVPVSSLTNGNIGSKEMYSKHLSSFAFQKCVVGVTQSTTEEAAKAYKIMKILFPIHQKTELEISSQVNDQRTKWL